MAEAAPHAKRGRKILVAIALAGALLFVGFVVLVAFASSNPSVQRILHLASESQRLSKAGEKAPGAAEVKAAGGCQILTIENMSELAALDREAFDGGSSAGDANIQGKIIVCIVPALKKEAPSCDALANAYIDAVHPDAGFYVSVTRFGAQAECTEGYSSLGDRLAIKKKK